MHALLSGLSEIKGECASVSNDVRDLIERTRLDIQKVCTTAYGVAAEATRERDEAVGRFRAEEARRRALLATVHELKGNIRVVCRVRPVLGDEKKGSARIAVQRLSREIVRCQGKDFEFDEVFGSSSTQTEVFEEIRPVVESVVEGHHACIFAYGQTGSGKTHTMTGTPNTDERGVNFRALETLFDLRDRGVASGTLQKCEFRVSNVEIYNERVRDLLKSFTTTSSESSWLQIREDMQNGVHLPDVTWRPASSPEDVIEAMEIGQSNRSKGHTEMNASSSRSHSVVMVEIRARRADSACDTYGRLVLVDLAGSERLDKSGVSGERQKEAQNINKSLSALGDVISALGGRSEHVPFRNSKLTYLLQNSMGADNKVMMIVQVAPTEYNAPESLCTLNFGARAKAVELGKSKTRLASARDVQIAHPVAAAPSKPDPRLLFMEKRLAQLEKELADATQKTLQLEIRARQAEQEAARAKQGEADVKGKLSQMPTQPSRAAGRPQPARSVALPAEQVAEMPAPARNPAPSTRMSQQTGNWQRATLSKSTFNGGAAVRAAPPPPPQRFAAPPAASSPATTITPLRAVPLPPVSASLGLPNVPTVTLLSSRRPEIPAVVSHPAMEASQQESRGLWSEGSARKVPLRGRPSLTPSARVAFQGFCTSTTPMSSMPSLNRFSSELPVRTFNPTSEEDAQDLSFDSTLPPPPSMRPLASRNPVDQENAAEATPLSLSARLALWSEKKQKLSHQALDTPSQMKSFQPATFGQARPLRDATNGALGGGRPATLGRRMPAVVPTGTPSILEDARSAASNIKFNGSGSLLSLGGAASRVAGGR